MPQTPHVERHFTGGAVVRDVVIGMADGLTVPFALAAGLSGAVASTAIVVTAGPAEIAAGSIAMGLGGYLAARHDAEHYAAERQREEREIVELADAERQEVADLLKSYGLTDDEVAPVVRGLSQRPQAWVDFMMRFELGLEAPDPRRALTSALTIAAAYIAGGLIPLAPYMLVPSAARAPDLGRRHAARAVPVRLRPRRLHRRPPAPQRPQHDRRRRSRGGRRLPPRPGDLVEGSAYCVVRSA